MIKKVGSQWGIYSSRGKLLGKHKTKREANAQLSAIEVSKQKRGKRK